MDGEIVWIGSYLANTYRKDRIRKRAFRNRYLKLLSK